MIEQLLAQFFEHLRYERNVSEHTLRNYASDLGQFYDYLAPADAEGKRREVDIRQIDHITIREWLSTLHAAQKKKTSVARKLAALRCHRTQMGPHNPIAWIDEDEAREWLGKEHFRRSPLDATGDPILEPLGEMQHVD